MGFLRPNTTIQTLIANNTVTINSFVVASGWSDSLTLGIGGFYLNTRIYTHTVSLNISTQTVIELNWSGINKIIFAPYGSGSLDVGIDNLCITF